jgi:hypothetical protein
VYSSVIILDIAVAGLAAAQAALINKSQSKQAKNGWLKLEMIYPSLETAPLLFDLLLGI